MTDSEVNQQVREIFKAYKGYFPNDEQLAEFVRTELIPVMKWMKEQNGLK